jgi:hypothetical protein
MQIDLNAVIILLLMTMRMIAYFTDAPEASHLSASVACSSNGAELMEALTAGSFNPFPGSFS